MKKIIALVTTIMMLCALTACSEMTPKVIAPKSFDISGPEIIPVGATVEYSCRIDFPEDADLSKIDDYLSNFKLIWSSSNEDIAQADKNGKITAIAQGETTITVKTEDESVSAQFNITVKPKYDIKVVNENIYPGAPIHFDITQTTVGGQGKVEFPYEGLNFTIKDDGILSIDDNGELIAGSIGETEMIVIDVSGNEYPVKITVLAKDASSKGDENVETTEDTVESELEETPIEIPDEKIEPENTDDTSKNENIKTEESSDVPESALSEAIVDAPKMNIIVLPLLEEPIIENIPGENLNAPTEPLKI